MYVNGKYTCSDVEVARICWSITTDVNRITEHHNKVQLQQYTALADYIISELEHRLRKSIRNVMEDTDDDTL